MHRLTVSCDGPITQSDNRKFPAVPKSAHHKMRSQNHNSLLDKIGAAPTMPFAVKGRQSDISLSGIIRGNDSGLGYSYARS